MLHRQLILAAATALVSIALSGCAGADGTDRGAIREAVIEPGITAIHEASALTCDADASALRTALGTYELLEGEPAPDEAALVAEQYLREESELWDIVDGELVPTNPGCG